MVGHGFHHVIPGLPQGRGNLFNKYSISTITQHPFTAPPWVHRHSAMCFGPLGKFKSYFSIVFALRGQYITVNESCHFYYQWSTAAQIKTRLHILPPRLSPQPHKIALPDRPAPPSPFLPSLVFVYSPSPVILFILVCLLRGSACIENDTGGAPATAPPPSSPLVACGPLCCPACLLEAL